MKILTLNGKAGLRVVIIASLLFLFSGIFILGYNPQLPGTLTVIILAFLFIFCLWILMHVVIREEKIKYNNYLHGYANFVDQLLVLAFGLSLMLLLVNIVDQNYNASINLLLLSNVTACLFFWLNGIYKPFGKNEAFIRNCDDESTVELDNLTIGISSYGYHIPKNKGKLFEFDLSCLGSVIEIHDYANSSYYPDKLTLNLYQALKLPACEGYFLTATAVNRQAVLFKLTKNKT